MTHWVEHGERGGAEPDRALQRLAALQVRVRCHAVLVNCEDVKPQKDVGSGLAPEVLRERADEQAEGVAEGCREGEGRSC